MPKDISSPFTPGVPVNVDYFVGRKTEVEGLIRRVAKAAATGRPECVFLVGERGIGKSSLASFVRALAEIKHKAIGVHAFLAGVETLAELVERVFDRLVKRSASHPWFSRLQELFGKHIRKAGLFSISLEFSAPERELNRVVADFPGTLRTILDKLKPEKQVLLLILDDINGLANSAQFANWLKSLIDEIGASQEPLPLCLMLVGYAERRDSLLKLQPSLDRILNVAPMKPWTLEETKDFFKKAFANVGIKVEDTALQSMAHYAGGLPFLAHEIGDAAFLADEDNHIDSYDASNAITRAAEIIGTKYLEPKVMRGLRSKHYPQILQRLAKNPLGIRFERSEVLKQLPEAERKVFDNFLRRMTGLGVIARDADHGAGAYRFTNNLHYVYFWMQAKPIEAERPAGQGNEPSAEVNPSGNPPQGGS